MKIMNILYLSENMSKYLGASYQTDFLDELTKSNNVTTYGPGYSGFSEKKNIRDIIKSCPNKIELVIFCPERTRYPRSRTVSRLS